MNFYSFHIGDYTSATQHLTDLEDLAYRRLLDTYYRAEKPIPLDRRRAYLLAKASSKAMREAVDAVLKEFFLEEEDGWHHRRCDAEILKAQGKMENNEERKQSERERLRRYREHRKALFAELRDKGISPPYDTQTSALQEMVRNATGNGSVHSTQQPVIRLTNPNPNPNPNFRTVAGDGTGAQSVDKAILEAMGELPQSASLHNTTAIHRLIADGYSLEQRILPAIREQAAKGKSFQSWGYIDKILRASPPTTATPDDELWRQRLDVCRRLRKWDVRYGPQPHTPGCRVPAQILHDTDGQDWTEWRPGDDL